MKTKIFGIFSTRYFLTIVLAINLFLSGCAYRYVDHFGNLHTWGVAHVVTRNISQEHSDIVLHQFATFGLAVLKDHEQLGFSLGYTRDFQMIVYDHIAGEFRMNPGNPAQIEYKDTYQIFKENGLWSPQSHFVRLQ